MSKIVVTRGLPGAGKSRWAREMCALFKGCVQSERDELRYLLTGAYYTGDQELEERVTRLQEGLVRRFLKEDLTVIISDTHLPDRSVKKWLKLGHELGVSVVVEDFRDVPLGTCIFNNAGRGTDGGKYVDPDVIVDKYDRFIKGRDLRKEVTYTPSTKVKIEPYVQPTVVYHRAYLVDVDGTLAHKHPDRDIYDGSKAHLDTLNKDVARLVDTLSYEGAKIIVMTGRSEDHRQVTADWLSAQDVCFDELYCRPSGDTRPDYIVKHELFQKHVAPKQYSILGVLDDRNSVVAMWRELGLTCFQVAEGNF